MADTAIQSRCWGVLSGSGQGTEGIRLPSGILTTSLCHQTASSTFPPHIFLYLLLFHPLIHPLSSLLPCTVNLLCAHAHARTHMASTAHINILMPLSLSSLRLNWSLFSRLYFRFQWYLLFCVLQQRIFVQTGKRKEGDDGRGRGQTHSKCNSSRKY